MTGDASGTEHASDTLSAGARDVNSKAARIVIDLLINKGLYFQIDVSTEIGERAEEIIRDGDPVTFDTFCTGCGRESTFRVRKQTIATQKLKPRIGE